MEICFVDDTGGYYMIRYTEELFKLPFLCPSGSYNVLKARLFGLSYPDYLRMARDNYSATLFGQTGYIIEKFKEKKDAEVLCKELNKRLGIIVKELKNASI